MPATIRPPTLFIFGGLPGTGKSTLSVRLARILGAVHLRIDTIEQAIRRSSGSLRGPEGYAVAYEVAHDNLRLGSSVVADSVNPIPITRDGWRDVARRAGVPFREIEILCSDDREHRHRVESRQVAIPGLELPAWEDVRARHYVPWTDTHLVVDTAGASPDESLHTLLVALDVHVRAHPDTETAD